MGESAGRMSVGREIVKEKEMLLSGREREEVRRRLDRALTLAKSGDVETGWQVIRGISGEYSHVPSLAFAEALVALQAGRLVEALDLTKISISRREQVAESLSLQGAINASSPTASGHTQEELLWKAVDADPMNPHPFLGLARLVSSQGDSEMAESLLQSANARLLPVDSRAVVDASLAILELQHSPAEVLAVVGNPNGTAEKDFPIAYAAMLRGDFQTAATVLERMQKTVAPEIFDYLINSTPLRDFSLEPEIIRFY